MSEKLFVQVYSEDDGVYEVGSTRKVCGTGHAFPLARQYALADEIAKRLNAHEALVEAATVALRIVKTVRGVDNDVVLALTAALEKAGVR